MKNSLFCSIIDSFGDDNGQGSVELILIIGGIIVIILLVVSMYKSYLVDLGTEIDSNELNALNGSFRDIASRFE
jgi:hypothetical protein